MRCLSQAGGLLQFESTFGSYDPEREEVGAALLLANWREELVMSPDDLCFEISLIVSGVHICTMHTHNRQEVRVEKDPSSLATANDFVSYFRKR